MAAAPQPLSAISGQLLTAGTLSALLAEGGRSDERDRRFRQFQQARRASCQLGPASSLRAIVELGAEPMARALGYLTDTADGWGVKRDEAWQPVTMRAASGRPGHMPLLVTAWGARLDSLWRPAVLAARSLQSRWVWLVNGVQLRLFDASATHTRRWTEIDLDAAADDPQVFWLLWQVAGDAGGAGAAARPPGEPSAPADERRLVDSGTMPWLDRLVADSDAFAADVCRSLRDGVRRASEHVLTAMAGRRPHSASVNADADLEQALTVVYRVLFLLFAESRGLVPMWHPVYRASYSIEALRTAAEYGRHVGMWEALRAISRLASAGCRTGQLNVTPFNGRLFDGRRAPFVDRHDLDDEAAGRAVLALTTRASAARGGRERIAYRDLGVEQLGAVYETLLDYQPARGARGVELVPGADARKATGSFYTPQPLARYLVRQTLAPLVRERSPEEILALRVLDPSMGSGAFLVAACQYLADAYEQALLESGAVAATDIGERDRAAIRRVVAERCLFGVDLNPMAVQLARLSLWLATLAGDRPLSFLDHHLRTGDSLLGAWLVSLQQPPAPGRRRRPGASDAPLLFDVSEVETFARTLVPARFALAGPDDTVDQVRGKEATLAHLERPGSLLSRWKQVADLWCAAWFADRTAASAVPRTAFGDLSDAILHGRSGLPSHVAERVLAPAAAHARNRRFFHWELEFPEVFFTADGQRHQAAGFDAIIGNPPWDMLRGDIGAVDDEDGSRARQRAEAARVVQFARESGVFAAAAAGQVNRYQLFVERSIALLREGGRFGLVLPGGLLSDAGSAPLRRLLFSRCAVDGVVSFENRRAIFPIHRSVRFLVLTATRGAATRSFGARFGATDLHILDRADSGTREWFPVHIDLELLARISGDDLSVPDVPQALDLAILERAASCFPPLGDPAGWRVRFGRELNATDDRHLFTAGAGGWPVVEGKHLQPFTVAVEDATAGVRSSDVRARLGRHAGRVRLAYRDIASATNRQTLIAALLPRHCVSTHTVFCLKTPCRLVEQHFLCGLFNSFLVNYLVRQRVSTHVTTAIVERLPVPTRAMAGAAFDVIADAARRLARRPDPARRRALAAGLNACVAALYQLTPAEYAHVLATFPLVSAEERAQALAAYEAPGAHGNVGSGG